MSCMSCVHILEIKPLSVTSFANIFSHSRLSFCSVYGFLRSAKLVSLIRSHLFIFAFISTALGDWSKKTLVQFISKNVLSMFSSRSFMVSYLMFGFPREISGKESTCQAGDAGLIPGLGRSPGEGNGNPLQYACLENPTDRGAWQPGSWWGFKKAGHDWVAEQQQQHLMLASLSHFESIFVYGVSECSNFTDVLAAVRFSQHNLLKRLSLLSCIFLPPLSKINWQRYVGLLWGSLFCSVYSCVCFCTNSMLFFVTVAL